MSEIDYFNNQRTENNRSIMQASMRGIRQKCPSCGEGHLFDAFVKVTDKCESCDEELHHHRADDLPAYLVIAIVGKIVVAGFITIAMNYDWSTWQHLALWGPITILLSLYFLPRVKGAIVGVQWALKMHGFGDYPDYDDSRPDT